MDFYSQTNVCPSKCRQIGASRFKRCISEFLRQPPATRRNGQLDNTKIFRKKCYYSIIYRGLYPHSTTKTPRPVLIKTKKTYIRCDFYSLKIKKKPLEALWTNGARARTLYNEFSSTIRRHDRASIYHAVFERAR